MKLSKTITALSNPIAGNLILLIMYTLFAIWRWHNSSAIGQISRSSFLILCAFILFVWIAVGVIVARKSSNPWFVAFVIGNEYKARDEREFSILTQSATTTLGITMYIALILFIVLTVFPPNDFGNVFYVMMSFVVSIRIIYQVTAHVLGFRRS